MGFLILLAALVLFWLVRPKHWQRSWKKLIQPGVAVLAAILVVASPAFSALLVWGLTANLPPDPGETADAIVVLGRGSALRDNRISAAWELWQAKRASHIFASGMMDARAIVQALLDSGIPDDALSGEECSQSTEENALFSSALLRQSGSQSIVVVTDAAHIWRSLLVFRSVGFNVVPHSVPLDVQALTVKQRLRLLVREYVGILAYALHGKFYERSNEKLVQPSPQMLQKISEWNCKVL